MDQYKKDLAERLFATVAFEPRFFLARYVLGEEPLTTSGLNDEIEFNYPDIFWGFFAFMSKNYAFHLCRKSLASIGLAEPATVVVAHPYQGAIDANAFKSTELTDEIEPFVNFWLDKQLRSGISASAYLAHLSGPTLEAPYNKAAIINELYKKGGYARIADLAYIVGLPYSKILNRLISHEALNAVKLEPRSRNGKADIKNYGVTMTENGRLVAKKFINPIFESLESNQKPSTVHGFTERQIYRFMEMGIVE